MQLKASYKFAAASLAVAALMSAQMAPTLAIGPVPTVKAHKGEVTVVSLDLVTGRPDVRPVGFGRERE